MLSKLGRVHSRALAEEVAEVILGREMQPLCDLLDPQALV